jgi:predicted SAM-dependent methyltransferase
MNFMPPKLVDVIWSIAVVSHLPLDAVKRWLKACHRILNDGGIIIFDYLDRATEEQKSLKDVVVAKEQMHDVVRELGYRFEKKSPPTGHTFQGNGPSLVWPR